MTSKRTYIFLGCAITLIVLGIIILTSASAPFSQKKFGTPYYYLNHQLLFGLLPGLVLAFVAFRIDLNRAKKFIPGLLVLNLALLGMVFIPGIGTKALGASRWLNFGPLSFQPSEFLKLSFILYLASWLSSRAERPKLKKIGNGFSQTFIVFLAILGVVSFFLILQPDISTMGILAVSAGIMYFLNQTPLWHSALVILAGTGLLASLVKLASYRINRLMAFLNRDMDPLGIGYQISQALIAVGSGGIWGQGLGMSSQRFGFLPQSMSDTIFAVFAEEAGFIGATILILLFVLFLWFGFQIGQKTHNKFFRLTVFGITAWISIQGFVNIGAMIGILPIAGIPLPFISYGGSALIAELIGVGIILNISRQT